MVVLTPADVSWKIAESQAAAVGSGVRYRKLSGVLEVMLNATCTASISSGAMPAILPVGFRPASSGLVFSAGYNIIVSLQTPLA